MADRPLKPATHRCLGKPLPYQLANGTQTPPSAHKAFKYTTCVMHCYPVLALLSKSCPRLKGRLSTRYSPVRHFNCSRRNFLVRLACVRHAASVRPEPGSNSQVHTPNRKNIQPSMTRACPSTLRSRYKATTAKYQTVECAKQQIHKTQTRRPRIPSLHIHSRLELIPYGISPTRSLF